MKTHLITLAFFISQTLLSAQATIELSDYKVLDNTSWQGYLTYKDFSSGKLTRVDATMQVNLKDDKVITDIQYMYEPNKNERSKVSIKKNGTFFGSEEVISNSEENGIRTIITKYKGKDNGNAAIQYKTYKFSKDEFTTIKEVQYIGRTERFVRNSYHFKIIE